MLSNGEVAGALVVSYDCEIDKSKRVLVAPVFEISSLPSESQRAVLEQRRFSLMPLPDVPHVGTFYADLRLIQAVKREFLPLADRQASMTAGAVDRLQVQLITFFTRRSFGSSAAAT
jgi:hypothetical protein